MRHKRSLLVTWLTLCMLLVPCLGVGAETDQKTDSETLTPEAHSAVLLDALSGRTLYEKAAHERLAPASITKIMTLVLIFEALGDGRIGFDDRVSTSETAAGLGGSQIWLEPGEEMTVRELVTAIAVGSANDACVAMAEHIAGSEAEFVRQMNARAAELGMEDSHFANCHGLDADGHHMSAADVALAARYACRFPQLLEFTSIWEDYLRGGTMWLVNTNRLVRFYAGADGLKTGSTDEAGFCVAATATRDDTRLIAVIMDAPTSQTRFAEATRLLNYGFANYTSVVLARQGEEIHSLPVTKGTATDVKLVTAADLAVTVKPAEAETVQRAVEVPLTLVAPVRAGQVVGRLIASREGETLGAVDLVAATDVPRMGFFGTVWRVFVDVLAMFQ